MIDFPLPTPLFNPLTAHRPLSNTELFAGPLGLLAFLPFVPLIRLSARRFARAALIIAALIWLLATARPAATGVLLGGILAGCGWIVALAHMRRAGRIGPRTMIALVWIGLHALALPLWWYANPSWYPSRMAALHALGFSYFLLRIVAWGVDLARQPEDVLRPFETLCWLLYPACMRNGPVMLRQEFLARFDAWRPAAPIEWREVGRRLGLAALGFAALGALVAATPRVAKGAADYFAAPQDYSTGSLVRVFYLVPIQAYVFLWTYNELAAGLAAWLGIRVDDNFHWLPAATSVKDFWRRWHITVGAWLRNYIYIPLGGNRGIVPLNYAAVFLYCGVWHGASWSFVAWGASQAAALTVQRWWDRWREHRGLQNWPSSPMYTATCWLLTMHYQLVTTIVFADFDHLGVRLMTELARRLA